VHGAKALADGLINESLIDSRLKNLFKVRMRLQHFDPPGPLQDIPASAICTKQTAAIARDGVVQVRENGFFFSDSKCLSRVF
jgi:hypothetical protein